MPYPTILPNQHARSMEQSSLATIKEEFDGMVERFAGAAKERHVGEH
jgi:hypothetical protein